nr:MAG: RNA-dependent RNA polymerase [Pseudoscorpian reo-like virus]
MSNSDRPPSHKRKENSKTSNVDILKPYSTESGVSPYVNRLPPESTQAIFTDELTTRRLFQGMIEYARQLLPVDLKGDLLRHLGDTAVKLTLATGPETLRIMRFFPPICEPVACRSSCTCARHLHPLLPAAVVDIPVEIAKPGGVDISYFKYDQFNKRVYVDDPNDSYLHTFDVQALMAMPTGQVEWLPNGRPDIRKACANGLRNMYARQVKQRGAVFQEALWQAILGYRCSPCARQTWYRNDHLCFQHSAGYKVIFDLLTCHPDLPFRITSDGVIATKGLSSASILPALIFHMMDSMGHIGCENMSDRLEGHLAVMWLDRARTNFFGEMFRRRKIFGKIAKHIAHRSPMIRFTYDAFPIINSEKCDVLPVDPPDLSDMNEPASVVDAYRILMNGSYHDEDCRHILVFIDKMSYNAWAYVTGSIGLSLEQSAQGRPGEGQSRALPKKCYKIRDKLIPVDFHFDSPMYSEWWRVFNNKLQNYEMELDNIEEDYFTSQTTNSAGLTDDLIADLRSELVDSIAGMDGPILAKMRGTRVIDVIESIQSLFRDEDSFVSALRRNKKIGKREQQGRRMRTIMMIGSALQVSGRLCARLIKSFNESMKHTVSGTGKNNVSDTQLVRVISSLFGFSNSIDVAQMDGSTKKRHVELLLAGTFHRYASSFIGNPRCFLGSMRTMDSVKEVPWVTLDEHGTITATGLEEINYPQYHLLLGIHGFESTTVYKDGDFQGEVKTSSVVFPSGWWPTSSHHTNAISIFLEIMKDEFRKGWQHGAFSYPGEDDALVQHSRAITLYRGVLGDDITLGLNLHTVTDKEVFRKVSLQASALLVWMLAEIGYKTESVIDETSAELLKVTGRLGAPETEPGRLELFSSERGDSAGSVPPARFGVMHAMIGELVGRSRYPEYWASHSLLASLFCASYSIKLTPQGYVSQKSKTRRGRRIGVGKISKLEIDRLFSSLTRLGDDAPFGLALWPSEQDGLYTLTVWLRGMWACSSHLGCPFPSIVDLSGQIHAGSSVFTLPTTAMTTWWLHITRVNPIPGGSISHTMSGVFHALSDLMSIDVDWVKQLYHGIGIGVTNTLDKNYDVRVLLKSGFFTGLAVRTIFPSVEVIRSRVSNPVLTSWKIAADDLLDPRRSNASRLGQLNLTNRRIRVPDELTYHASGSTKVVKALYSVALTGGEHGLFATSFISELTKFDKKNLTHESSFRDEMYSGEIIILQSTIDAEPLYRDLRQSGFGHCVPPNSGLAELIYRVGMPDNSAFSIDAFQASVLDDKKLSGDPQLYARLYRQADQHGDTAKQDLRSALGFSNRQFEQLARFADVNPSVAGVMRYALQPRRHFYLAHNSEIRDHYFVASTSESRVSHNIQLIAMGFGFMFPKSIYGSGKRHWVVASPRSVALYVRR